MFLRVKQIVLKENEKDRSKNGYKIYQEEGENVLIQIKDIKKIRIDRLEKDFAEVKCRFVVTSDEDYFIPEFKVSLTDALVVYTKEDVEYIFIVLLSEILNSRENCIDVGKSFREALSNRKILNELILLKDSMK